MSFWVHVKVVDPMRPMWLVMPWYRMREINFGVCGRQAYPTIVGHALWSPKIFLVVWHIPWSQDVSLSQNILYVQEAQSLIVKHVIGRRTYLMLAGRFLWSHNILWSQHRLYERTCQWSLDISHGCRPCSMVVGYIPWAFDVLYQRKARPPYFGRGGKLNPFYKKCKLIVCHTRV